MLGPANDTPEALFDVLVAEVALGLITTDFDSAIESARDAVLEVLLLKDRLGYMKGNPLRRFAK